jgi:hypothetical protein
MPSKILKKTKKMNLKKIAKAPRWEGDLKKARDKKIAELKDTKTDEELLTALEEMPEVDTFIKNIQSAMPRQIRDHIAVETRSKLRGAFKKSIKNARENSGESAAGPAS